MARPRLSLLKTSLLLFLLPVVIFAVKKVLDLRKSATGALANIVIDAQKTQGLISPSLWQNLSQGGEESADMIKPIIHLLRAIQPKLIRIDHIFDYYQVDQGNGQYDFSRLDGAVNSILATGAKPMLSLSYTPDAKAPSDWNQWYQLVKATAAHYSVDKNISGIYYEVWNEPDLFGGWKYNQDPNYSTLYLQTSRAVVNGAGNTIYKIGGPATTAYYHNWMKALFQTATDNHLRLDFISWHKYTKNLDQFQQDFDDLNQILTAYPQFFNLERLITEVGPNSDPDAVYDNSLSGIHLISLSTRLAGKIHRLFTFEAVDGPTPRSDVSSGWGIITHDLKPKPRYSALQFLNQLIGQRLNSTGDGSWITALSSLNDQTIQILLVNYDSSASHAETFPLTVKNLAVGKYKLKTTYYMGNTTIKIVTTTVNYRDQIYLPPNSAVFLELTPAN
jgi:hypothetical protein